MHRTVGTYTVLFLVVFGISHVLIRSVRSQNAKSEPHKPFTAFQVERRYDAAGVERYHEYKTYAVRTDGSSAWFANRPGSDGQIHVAGAIYDVPNQRVTGVDGFTESTTTETFGPGLLAVQTKVDHSCQTASERSVILGQEVVKVVKRVDPPIHPVETTDWAAPGLDCFVFSQTAVHYTDGQPDAKNTLETLFVIPGEPSASLFTAPPNFVERSPSQIADEYTRRFGPRPFSDSVLQRSEERYHARHQ